MTAQADALMGIFGFKRMEREMKTDSELLELAAKAVGYQVRWHENWQCFVHVNPHNIDNPPTPAGKRLIWVPLTDDGDALRLAVKLHFDIQFYWNGCDDQYDEVCAYTHGAKKDASEQIGFYLNGGQIDECAATRRAIVRAAAAIGEAMP